MSYISGPFNETIEWCSLKGMLAHTAECVIYISGPFNETIEWCSLKGMFARTAECVIYIWTV